MIQTKTDLSHTYTKTKTQKKTKKVLDTKCFERLLGKCIHLLKAGIRTYKFVDADINVDEKNW